MDSGTFVFIGRNRVCILGLGGEKGEFGVFGYLLCVSCFVGCNY